MTKVIALVIALSATYSIGQVGPTIGLVRAEPTFNDLVKQTDSICKFTEEPLLLTLRNDPAADAATGDFCVGAARCQAGDDEAATVVICESEGKKCDKDVKSCHNKITDAKRVVHVKAQPSTKVDVPLNDFVSCNANPSGMQAVYVRVGSGKTDWHNACMVGATCKKTESEKADLTFVACAIEGTVKIGANEEIVCPQFHACVNHRYQNGNVYPPIPK